MSSHVIAIDIDVYSAFVVIFNILCLEVAYDSMRLFYWYLHYIYDIILYLCIMYYTVCYLTGIFYAVVRQISMLSIDNKISVFCIEDGLSSSNCGGVGGRLFYREEFPTDLSAGVRAVKERHKGTLQFSIRWMRAHHHVSRYLGLDYV